LPGCNSASHLGAQPSTARSEVSSEVSTCDDDPRVQSRVRLDTVLEFVTNLMAVSPTHCARVAPCKRLKLEGGPEKSCVFLSDYIQPQTNHLHVNDRNAATASGHRRRNACFSSHWVRSEFTVLGRLPFSTRPSADSSRFTRPPRDNTCYKPFASSSSSSSSSRSGLC
jgi:hypothetical protein